MLFIFLSSLSSSIYCNLSISNLKLSGSPLLLSRSPLLNPPLLRMTQSYFSIICLSKLTISNSFSPFFYVLNSNYRKVLFKHIYLNSFLSTAILLDVPDICKTSTDKKEHCILPIGGDGYVIDDCHLNDVHTNICGRYTASGGALYIISPYRFSITRSTFTGCYSSIQGGAIFVTGPSNIDISNCNFTSCKTAVPDNSCVLKGAYGAAIGVYQAASITISLCVFKYNLIEGEYRTDDVGFALFFDSCNAITVQYSQFDNDESCKFDLAFKLGDDSNTISVMHNCFLNPKVDPISDDLDKSHSLNLLVFNNSFATKNRLSFSSVNSHSINTDGNFYENTGKCLWMVKASTPLPTPHPTATATPPCTKTPTSTFSNTNFFTKSSIFSLTTIFTSSIYFSKSVIFSDSQFFGPTEIFSPSVEFSLTVGFTQSGKFSLSSLFSQSSDLSISKEFTQSKYFSRSKFFSKTKVFSKTEIFTRTEHFSGSTNFTASAPLVPIPGAVGRDTSLSKGGIAGIVIACLVLLAIIIALIIFFLHRKKSAFIPPEDDPMNIDGLEIPVNMYD